MQLTTKTTSNQTANLDNVNIPKVLKQRRIAAGLTQEQVASVLFVSDKTYSAYECGRNVPSVHKLIMLTKLYKIDSLDKLLECVS